MARREEVGIEVTAKDSASPVLRKTGDAIADVGTKAEAAARSGGTFGTVMSGLAQGAGIAGMLGLASATSTVIDGIGKSIQAASDLNEQGNKVDVVFGAAAQSVRTFGTGAATSLGLSNRAALEATGTLGNMFTAMGIGTTKAAAMSMTMVRLAADLGSFNNIPVDVALEKIRAGLAGETEPLRQLGVNISEAALRAQALKMGLDVGTGALDAQSRTLAAYQLILAQTATAQGDFSRTSDELANKQKQLGSSMEDLGAKIGAYALPAMTDFVTRAERLIVIADRLSGSGNDAADGVAAVGEAAHGSTNPVEALWNVLSFSPIPGLIDTVYELTGGEKKLGSEFRDLVPQVKAAADAHEILRDAMGRATTTAYLAATGYIPSINAYATLGNAALAAAERIDILRDAQAGADMTAKIAATGAWTATTAFYAQNAGLERAGMGVTAVDERMKRLTTTMGGAGAATDRLRSQQDSLRGAYDALRDRALDALGRIRDKTLAARDAAMAHRQALYDAYVASVQGPVDAARAALEEERAKRALEDAQNDLNAAMASGDAAAIASARRRLDDMLADKAIADMQKEADAKIAAAKADKDAQDAADKAAKDKANADYEAAKKKLEDQIKWLEGHLDNVNAAYRKRVTDLLGSLKGYGLDFETIGKTMGTKYATGVTKGLEGLMNSIARKVAALLGSGATIPVPDLSTSARPPAGTPPPAAPPPAAVPATVPSVAPTAPATAAAGAGSTQAIAGPGATANATTTVDADFNLNVTVSSQAFVGSPADAKLFAVALAGAIQDEAARRGFAWPTRSDWMAVRTQVLGR